MTQRLPFPTEALSYTMFDMYRDDRKGFFDRYFRKLTPPVTPALAFGRRFADMLEQINATGEWPLDESEETIQVIRELAFLGEPERTVTADMGEFFASAKMDTSTPALDLVIDYKTGAQEWTEERARESAQLKFYAMVVEAATGRVPRTGIQWAETRQVSGTSLIEFTGRVETFIFKQEPGSIRVMREITREAARDISRHWLAFRGELPGLCRDVFDNYARARALLDQVKKAEEETRQAYIAHLEELGLERLEIEQGVFSVVMQTRWDYPDTVTVAEANLEALKQRAQEDGSALAIPQPVYQFRTKEKK